jgi:hypothetical protein|tara:strand:+ start:2217 stop:2483 length:267 start_codon:yes stop_codon:yes gene_type:complete
MAFVFEEDDKVLFFSRNRITYEIVKICKYISPNDNITLKECINAYMFNDVNFIKNDKSGVSNLINYSTEKKALKKEDSRFENFKVGKI